MTDSATRLSAALADRYRIERELGAGGMATVYLAHDLKHERKVAIKVLKPELAAVIGGERFLSEIKTTANLQHPHILALFDSGAVNGTVYYAMPFVDGESLRDRLTREKQLPIDDALRIAREVADALQYAHERGVIHRDIKPENILLQGGHALVADFGIALAASSTGGARMTETGMSLGTPTYMSPEQAMGERTLDARTDVYALGCVLYEMLVGDPPFTGSTAQAIVARVLTGAPESLTAQRSTIPPHVEATVMTSLQKLPADRQASAREFAAQLSGASAVRHAGRVNAKGSGISSATPKSTRLALALTSTLALVGIASAAWLAARPQPEMLMRRFTIDAPDSVRIAGALIIPSMAITHDGTLVAFAGTSQLRRKLYVRHIDAFDSREIPGTENASRPLFSYDGRTLFFLGQSSALFSVPTAGGTPRMLVDSVEAGMDAGDDGNLYIIRGRTLLSLRPETGERRVLATFESGSLSRFGSVAVLPGSRQALLVVVSGSSLGELVQVDLQSGEMRPSGIEARRARYVDPGVLMFANVDGELRAAPLNTKGLPDMGRAQTLVTDAATGSGGGDYAVASREGTVVYRRERANPLPPTQIQLTALGRAPRVLRSDDKRYDEPVVSPDGRHAVVRVGGIDYNHGDLWLLDLQSGAFTPLTRDNGSFRPAWSRDGKRVIYMTGTPILGVVHALPWDGSGPDSIILKQPSIAQFVEGPRGGWSVVRDFGQRDLYIVPTDSAATAKRRPLVASPANETNAQLSPDGRFVAYQSDQSGEIEVYVTAVPGPGPRVPVSVGGGRSPQWSADGTRLYYRSGVDLRVAKFSEHPEVAFTKGEVVPGIHLVDDQEWSYAPLANGTFLTTPGPPPPPTAWQLGVITNWTSMLTNRDAIRAKP